MLSLTAMLTATTPRKLLQVRVVPGEEHSCEGKGHCLRANAPPHHFTFCTRLEKEVSSLRRHNGVWEPAATGAFVQALKAVPGAQVIDVGARSGWFSTVGAIMGHRVLAVEPNYESSCYVERNAAKNNVSQRVVLANHGADAEEREMKIQGMRMLPPDSKEAMSKVDGVFTKVPHIIRTVRLDSLIPLTHSRTLVIKLDIEGYECEALMGAGRLLRSLRVAFLMMEWDGGLPATRRGCDWNEAVRPLLERGLVPQSSPSISGPIIDFRPMAAPIPTTLLFWRDPSLLRQLNQTALR